MREEGNLREEKLSNDEKVVSYCVVSSDTVCVLVLRTCPHPS